jgi:glycosyltransferase involved in cell wall biosynthesis
VIAETTDPGRSPWALYAATLRLPCRMKLSVVIPTLNEAGRLADTVDRVRRAARGEPFEWVVSDCDSPDGTAEVARRLGAAAVATGGTCRSEALNRGAASATGDALLFLHADTELPAGFVGRVRRALRPPDVVGGAFEFAFAPDDRDGSGIPLGWVSRRSLGLVVFCNRLRYRYGRGFFGDQGIFVRRSAFDRLGGFPPIRLLEDLRFSQAMARLGRTAILGPPALTSPRRFVRRGVLRQFLQDWRILAYESFGVAPVELWHRYNAHNCEAAAAAAAESRQARIAATDGTGAKLERGSGRQHA